MDRQDFMKVMERFQTADTEGKIDIYVSTEGLDSGQYRELLKLFPYSEIHKLEAALA